MDKNSVIGWILIAAILIGFSFYQSKQAKAAYEQQRIADSIALANAPVDTTKFAADSLVVPADTAAEAGAIYKDASLDSAHSAVAEQIVFLENDKMVLGLTNRGAHPKSVKVKDYYNYDSTELFIFKDADMAIHVYAGEYINTADFSFNVAEQTDSSVVFRLPFSGGGYIEQTYILHAGEYRVDNNLAFVGNVIPRNVGSVDIDYSMMIPRMEKGYKYESQYSGLDFYQEGDKKTTEMGKGRSASRKVDSKLSWFVFRQQFFSAFFRAKNQYASGQFTVDFAGQDDPDHNLMKCTALTRVDITPGETVEVPFEYYFGPNHYRTLKSYDQKYEKTIPLGGWLVGWFTKYVIIPMFDFFSKFIKSYGLIILLMTLIIKLIVLPFTYKSFSSSAKMQALKPEMDKINERYPKQEDALKKQQATMDLYKRAGVSPMGGCLPTLLTFPILWAMFRFFPASIELRQQPFLWADDLSTYDSILDFSHRVPLLGDHLSLFALLMAVVMWVYSKMNLKNQSVGNDPSQQSMQFMMLWMMPIMMFFICNNLSAALSYYYLLSQLISMVEVWLIKKFGVDQEKILAKARAAEGKPVQKSKWQQRLEEAQKMQQQQMREQQKKNGSRK